jgi:heptosyltransferase-2
MDVDAQALEACAGRDGTILMERSFKNILVVQTAFIGDAILTLPLIQVLKTNYIQSAVDVVVVPRTAEIFAGHPAISNIIIYDKRGRDKGLLGLMRLRDRLEDKKYDLVIVPHRSIRSALLSWMLRPAMSIGFDTSAGRWLFKSLVRYDPSIHEIERNLSLLAPLKIPSDAKELPRLYPSIQDVQKVESSLNDFGLAQSSKIIAVAPGTVWNTKRWPADRFAALCKRLAAANYAVVLIGSKEDEKLCEEVIGLSHVKDILNMAGKLSLLQSAEMIRRSKVLISNDSAPLHLAVAVGTPVAAIFGATVPEFGFAPRGMNDIVIEIKGLKCRPCAIHGGKKCPIKTFECMLSISPEYVFDKVMFILSKT